ncbi:hypothetical protein [Mycobacterium sp. SMC-11]|uniref:hypothetical protein n=1 Tax=Mycobacterium sp. SMC-11 TaxID=3385969 RepID=UPI00390CD24D
MKIEITRADVREFVEATATGVNIDAVVSELVARLPLVGEHPMTTALNPTTIQAWIAIRGRDDLGVDKYEEILRNSAC